MTFLSNFLPKKRVFLDYASTTPILKEVEFEINKKKTSLYFNPSALYSESILAKEELSSARKKIANIISSQKEDIVFTSGGTESNNLAILGVFEANRKNGFTQHFVTTTIEHPAVLEVFKEIENRGGEVTIVPVGEDGIVSPKSIKEVLRENTVLVSVMYANNEIGTIQPINEISKVIREFRKSKNTILPYFHTDACQAPSYLDMNVLRLGVDLMTVDGIKIYGPRGSGFLYVRGDVKIKPIVFGGGQEKGLRSGTENISNVVGLAKALEIVTSERERESKRLELIRDYGIKNILEIFPKASLNGSHKNRLPNNLNICFHGLDAEFSVISLDVNGVCASYSSSCRTLKEDSSSYVISNIGKENCSLSSLRFTMGRGTKKSDIDYLIKVLKKVIK
ncbi:MAG: cysteine desulfurase [Parcubacteria bacterium C7867-006]|nr:MAG: cysteine desulfurase [Parcubacteria bacterium C7867-006]